MTTDHVSPESVRQAKGRFEIHGSPTLRLCTEGGTPQCLFADIGTVSSVEALPQSWELALRWQDPRFGRYVCEKASIAVDGISLTVADCSEDGANFTLAVIPHTWGATTLQQLAVGDRVNLEADLLARYAERLLAAGPRVAADRALASEAELGRSWLEDHGWT